MLYNPRLQLRYDVRDDIPVMLIDEAVTVDDAEHERVDGCDRARRDRADVHRADRRAGLTAASLRAVPMSTDRGP